MPTSEWLEDPGRLILTIHGEAADSLGRPEQVVTVLFP
jgi:hypothetical protein